MAERRENEGTTFRSFCSAKSENNNDSLKFMWQKNTDKTKTGNTVGCKNRAVIFLQNNILREKSTGSSRPPNSQWLWVSNMETDGLIYWIKKLKICRGLGSTSVVTHLLMSYRRPWVQPLALHTQKKDLHYVIYFDLELTTISKRFVFAFTFNEIHYSSTKPQV